MGSSLGAVGIVFDNDLESQGHIVSHQLTPSATELSEEDPRLDVLSGSNEGSVAQHEAGTADHVCQRNARIEGTSVTFAGDTADLQRIDVVVVVTNGTAGITVGSRIGVVCTFMCSSLTGNIRARAYHIMVDVWITDGGNRSRRLSFFRRIDHTACRVVPTQFAAVVVRIIIIESTAGDGLLTGLCQLCLIAAGFIGHARQLTSHIHDPLFDLLLLGLRSRSQLFVQLLLFLHQVLLHRCQ